MSRCRRSMFLSVTDLPVRESIPPVEVDLAQTLDVKDVVKVFPGRGSLFQHARGGVPAVRGVSLRLSQGETLGLVGESGSGKSTLGRIIVRLIAPTSGTVAFRGLEIAGLRGKALRGVRSELQMVFQDPYSSLDPRMSIFEIVAEPISRQRHLSRAETSRRVFEVLDMVGLSKTHASRRPAEFSGGQRQRIGIARALAPSPSVIVLDEPVSSLDVSIQAQVLNLLEDLQKELRVSYLFISHDLSVVRHVADRVAVMYLGRIVEVGSVDQIFEQPAHPYTKALLSAAPLVDSWRMAASERIILKGEPPSPVDPPSGCAFRARCWKAEKICAGEVPLLQSRRATQAVACYMPLT
jgi:oligopeptide transport system ATP-binding protein